MKETVMEPTDNQEDRFNATLDLVVKAILMLFLLMAILLLTLALAG